MPPKRRAKRFVSCQRDVSEMCVIMTLLVNVVWTAPPDYRQDNAKRLGATSALGPFRQPASALATARHFYGFNGLYCDGEAWPQR
jgi:hypothetical protein